MVERPAKSTRGLGRRHRDQRARLLSVLVEGSACPFMLTDPKCTGPMYAWQDLDADHSHARVDGGVVADRLAHSSCNRREGQRIATRRRAAATLGAVDQLPRPPARPVTSRRW